MIRLLALALALAVASFANAEDNTSTAASGFSARKKAANVKPPEKVSPAVQKLRDVDTAKAAFMAALGACQRPESCDPSSPARDPELVRMLKGREDAFMEACVQCASDKACEEERAKIREGRGRFGYNVCAPPGTKPPAASKAAPAKTPPATPPAQPSK